jgi:hypothetical protein
MVGGCYLCFEGAEKIWTRIAGHQPETVSEDVARLAEDVEAETIAGAIRTDFILSAEIMVIALNEVADEPFAARAAILAVVAVAITILVYGVVALIVKMDDVGLHLAQRRAAFTQAVGRGMVRGMPKLLATISAVGVVAMLWVGGHILLVGTDDLGWHWLYGLVHDLEQEAEHAVESLGTVVAWLVNTFASGLIGLVVGAVIVAAMHLRPSARAAGAH